MTQARTNAPDTNVKICPRCNGSGYIIILEDASDIYGKQTLVQSAMQCPDCHGALSSRALKNRQIADIPRQFSNVSMFDFDWNYYDGCIDDFVTHNKSRSRVNSFISQFPKWKSSGMGLYIYSKTKGSGKTMLACCIMNDLINRYGLRGQFVSVSGLIESVQRQKKELGRNLLDIYKDTDILILDDIGAKKSNEWLFDYLFQILDARLNSKKITILTSNYTVSELEFDDRIADRINACTIAIKLPEVSIRTKQAASRKTELLSALGIA